MVSRSLSHRDFRLLIATLSLLLFTAQAQAYVPNAPAALGAAVINSTSTVYLTFDDNATNETAFDVQYTVGGNPTLQHYSVNTGDTNNTTATMTGTGNVIIAIGLSPSTTYTFQVAAYAGVFNPGNTSTYTSPITVTTGAFGTPVIATTTVTNETAVRFAIVDNAYSEAGYFYEYSAAGGSFVSAGSTGPSVSNVNFPGLQPGTAYQFRIRGFQGTVASPTAYTPYSNTVSVTTPFNAPTGLTATNPSENSVTLSWADNSAAEVGYLIYYRTSGSGSYTALTSTAANATTYTVTGLTPGTAYDFQVDAGYQATQSSPVIESARSNTATASTKNGFTSRTYQPITYNQAFSYQAVVSTGSARTSWNITGLPTGLTFNSSTGIVSGTPTVTGVFSCPMTATFANGSTSNNTLQLRVIRAAGAPVTTATISGQTLASGGNTSVTLSDKFSDPDSESAVRVITNEGTMDFILYNTATPQTVTNFLSYVNNAASTGNYTGAVFHRAISGFIVQGGGFKVQSAPNNFTSILTTASPTNEPGISNLRGTVAMAKVGTDPNSATDQFFVNVADNSSNLDNQNGGFTAFARVAGNGMTVADTIAGLPTVSTSVNVDGTANTGLTSWPVTSGSTMDTTKMVTISSAAPVAVLSYSVTGNTNPTAVTASISGTNVQINGVAGGQSNVTVTATDLDGSTTSQTFAVTVNQAPAITSAAPSAGGTVGAPYNFSYTASGFPVPTFTVTSGVLPTGLSLSSAGVISGTATAAGTFTGTVTATNSVSTNPQSFTITIAKAAATVSLGSLTATYDGTAHAATATTTPAGKTVTFTYAGSSTPPTNAGTYAVVGTINDTNYTGTATGSLVIAQASATVSLGSLAQTYDGTSRVATATTTPAGKTVTFTYDGSSTAPTNAGTYVVVGTISDTNYSGTATGSLVVTKATGSVSLGSLAQTYDGTSRVATATTTPAGKTVTFTYDGSSTAPTNAGTYVVVGTISDTNYSGTATGSLVVAKAAGSVSLGSLTPTYDGTAHAATATTTPSGKTVTFTYNGSATVPTNAGSYTVVGTINDTNYSGTATSSLVIAQASATVSLGSLAQTYDGTAHAATATTTPSGKTVTFTYNGSATVPTNAGSYTVVGTISDTNYSGTATSSLVIAQASATVSLGSLSQTYDGTAHAATATTTPAGKTVTFTYNGSATAPTNAGSYTVVGTISDTNYAGTATSSLVIAQASATVSLGSLSQTYNGSAHAATATTTPGGKTVTFTYNGSATAPTNAGSYTVVGTISDTNYTGSSTPGTLVIAQAAATITFTGTTQTYDGSAKAVTATTSPAGLTVSLTYNGSSSAPSNFGSYTVAATITDTNYTGTQTGTLLIQGQSSSAWKSQHFTAGQISSGIAADNADPDGDGLKNLAEYAMGTDPLAWNAAPQPTHDANGLTLIFTRPKGLPDVSYTAESTDTLGSWSPVTLEVITDGPVQTVRARDTLATGNPNRRFMHLIFGTP